jgi:hypothetical protein
MALGKHCRRYENYSSPPPPPICLPRRKTRVYSHLCVRPFWHPMSIMKACQVT